MEYEVHARLPRDLDAFTRGYLECAEWCGIDEEQRNAFHDADSPRWSAASLKRAREDCAAFQRDMEAQLEASGLSDSRAGHDFWLTRNRHGAGFWDEGYKQSAEANAALQELTEESHAYGDAYVYFDVETQELELN
jgi:hypothetical protein